MCAIDVSSPNVWNLSKLYTTGEVTFLTAAGLPGDFNGDNAVDAADAADYVTWRKGLGTATYTQAAYNVWAGANFGTGSGSAIPSAGPLSPAVPEPATLPLLTFAMAGWCLRRGRGA